MTTRRASQLAIAYNPDWKKQSAWDAPLDGSLLTKAFPATSRNYLDLNEIVEDIEDCTGEDLLFELLTGRSARLNIDFDVDPDVFAGLVAFAYGVAAAPTGGTNEVQTETITASGGTRILTVQTGADTQSTTPIAWDANAAAIQAALEALPNVASGDISVAAGVADVFEVQREVLVADGGSRTFTVGGKTTGPVAWNATNVQIQAALETLSSVHTGDIVVTGPGGGPFVFTFASAYNAAQITSDATLLTSGMGAGSSTMSTTTQGVSGTFIYTFGAALGKQDVNLIAVNTFGLTEGTSSFLTTTPGVGLTHAITRMTGYTLPLMTLYVGFRGSDKQPKIFKNVVVNSFRVRAQTREKVTANVELIGSGDLEDAVAFSMPDCQDLLPIRFGDCAMTIAGTDYIGSKLGREFEYYFQNNVNPKFDGAGIDSTRAERADKRPSQYSFFVLGEPGDALDLLVKLRASFPVSLQLGPAGRYVKCTSPQALVKQAPTAIRFGGDPPESELAIIGRPRKVSGDATTPTTVEAKIATTATLLTSA